MPVQRLPIIGFPLRDTPTEAVLRAALSAAGREVELERWERKPHQLPDALADLRKRSVIGALIMPPHKEKAAALIGSLSDDARASGAVNVVVGRGTKVSGHNTDIDGVRTGLAELLSPVVARWPRNAVVLGAGGGARAVVSVLIHSGVQHIAVFNRHLHKAEALVGHFARVSRHMELRARPWHETIIEAELAKAGLLVNATVIGAGDEAPIDTSLLPEGLVLLDLILHREETTLMAEVRARGGTAANGRHSFMAAMGVTFRLLTDAEAPTEVMEAALREELGSPSEGAAMVGD